MTDPGVIRVVVIDDHQMILDSVVRLLRDDSRIVVVGTALTATEGVEVTRRERPDVVILDYHLPDMDAPAAITQLRAAHPDGRIITFSGSARPAALYAAMRAGSSAWLEKTRAIQELRDLILHVAAGGPITSEAAVSLPVLDELEVHYQPIVKLEGRGVVGFEALVRWQHPERGLLLPSEFLPLAEETGFIEEIDRRVREQAIQQLAQWQREYVTTPRLWMSVNLSVRDLEDPDLVESIQAALAAAGVDPADLVVEVTESVLLEDTDRTMDCLNRLKAIDVGLAIDDFGTGFSSISYLRRFPFDHLKLDLSFTNDLPHSTRTMLLVEQIGHIADSMNMMGIAEGIENEEQAEALQGIGWTYGQGYLFSRPMHPSSCHALLGR